MKPLKYVLKISLLENAFIALMTVIYALIPTALLVYTASFIDTAVEIVQNQGDAKSMVKPLGIILLLMLAQFFTSEAIKWGKLLKSRKVNSAVRLASFDKKDKLSYERVESDCFWKEMAVVEKDPEMRIARYFDQGLALVALTIRILGFTLVLMRYLWWMGLLVIAVSALMMILSKRLGKFDYEAFEEAEMYYHRAAYFEKVLSSKEASEERTLFNFHEWVNQQWDEWFKKGVMANNHALKKLMIRMSSTHLMSKSIAIIIGFLLLIPLKEELLTAGLYMSLLGNGFHLVDYMTRDLVQILKTMHSDKNFLQRFLSYLALEDENMGDVCRLDLSEENLVTFNKVSFKYPETDHYIIKNLSFSFERGKRYALVGENGAGKSTLVKLMLGLYRSYEGEIYIGGVDLKACSKEAISSFYSTAFQDFFPYEIPLEDFLTLGLDPKSISENELWKCLEPLGLKEIIEAFPDKLKTPMGKLTESSVTFSGGQLQKLVIGRTLLKDAPFTILDEPTAAIDPIQERALYKLFMSLEKGKTSLIITHRLGAAVTADEILVLNQGQFVAKGTHEALLQEKGQYYDMYEAQKGWYYA